MILSLLLVALLSSVINCAEIIREPETQYVLMGENATFECHATGAIEAHWDVDGVPLTPSYEKTKKEYVDQGFIFIDEKDISRESYNLTMIIPASLDFNNTVISCVAISSGYNTQTQSRNVHLIVFDTLRPYQPSILIVEVFYPEQQPTIHITINEPPRWPGYEISEFRMNITMQGDSSLLHQINSSNITGNYTVDIYEPLQSSTAYCSSLMVSASAVSSLYGESEFSQYCVNTPIYKAPGIFPENGLNLTAFHYFNDVPFPLLQIKLPDVCVNQPINYTLIIETDSEDKDAAIISEGPYSHLGPGLVPHIINGVQHDRNYSIFVQVNSIAGSSESDKLHFDTYNINLDTVPDAQPESTTGIKIENCYTKKESNTTSIALGLMIAVLSPVLLTVCVILLLFCVFNNKVKKEMEINVELHSMMPRPEPGYVNAVRIPEPVYVNTADRDHD